MPEFKYINDKCKDLINQFVSRGALRRSIFKRKACKIPQNAVNNNPIIL
jgi:hypothetical protein